MRPAVQASFLVGLLCSCVVRAVQPTPPPPARSTTIYLLSEEGHTGILLPNGEGWVEWAFGDYVWYAAGRGDLGWGLYTAMRATTGGLARRAIGGDPLLDTWSRARGTVLFPYPADRGAVTTLAERLEAEFRAGGQPSFNPLFGFHVVPAQAPYSMWFNCTDAAATWLAELGIEAPTRGICARILGRPGTELAAPPPDDGELVRDRVRAFGGVAGDGRGQ